VEKLCPFSKVCRGYSKDSFTCHDSEQEEYCEYYRRHKAEVLMGEMSKMLKGTDFEEFGV